jgi:hypothetical protein
MMPHLGKSAQKPYAARYLRMPPALWTPDELRTRDFQRVTLRPRHRPVVRALAEALYSPDGEVSAERLDAFVDEVDGFISPASKTLRFALKSMLDIMRLCPLLILGKPTLFENLSLADRIKMLERMDRHKIQIFSLVLVAFKTLMTIAFYEDPVELKQLGYPGEERERYRRLLPMASSEERA